MPAGAITEVAARLDRRTLDVGEVLFRAGDPADAMYGVVAGRLIVEDPTGRVLAALGPGSTVGESGLLLESARSGTVRAVKATALWVLAKPDLDVLVATHPKVALAVGREVSRHLQAANNRTGTPTRLVVAAASVAGDLAREVAGAGDPVGLLDLTGRRPSHQRLPDDVILLPHDLADPEAIAELASEPAVDLTVTIAALPDHPTEPGNAAATLAHHSVDLNGATLAPWVRSLVGPVRHLRAPRRPGDLERIIRWVRGRAVGLALSSGGSKAIAHVGVVQVLRQAGIPIDAVAGTSGGAIVAAGVAAGFDDHVIGRHMAQLPELFRYRRLGPRVPPIDGLFSGASLLSTFERWFAGGDVADTTLPLYVVAADANTGREVVLIEGSLAKALRASMGIPALFVPVEWNGRWLVDGGIVAPLPARVLRDAGVGMVIGSNVAGQASEPAERGAPGLVDMLGRMVASLERQVVTAQQPLADIVIRPVVRTSNSFDFRSVDTHVQEGRRAAMEGLDEILAGVARLGRSTAGAAPADPTAGA